VIGLVLSAEAFVSHRSQVRAAASANMNSRLIFVLLISNLPFNSGG
jgi:hypothetical protein